MQLLARHFLSTYDFVVRANIRVSALPWTRVVSGCGREHNHAFVVTPQAQRWANVVQRRGQQPQVRKIMKLLGHGDN